MAEKVEKIEEVTAEFKTEEIKEKAEILTKSGSEKPEKPKKLSNWKSWIPFAVGFLALASMIGIAFYFWFPGW